MTARTRGELQAQACAECKGACCEQLHVPISRGREEEYGRARGVVVRLSGQLAVRLEQQCAQLDQGRCSIYASRPVICREYAVGGMGCLDAVRERRPEQAERLTRLAKGRIP